MTSQHVAGTRRALPGRFAFAHAAAVAPQGACMASPRRLVGGDHRWLDGANDQIHSGKGGA